MTQLHRGMALMIVFAAFWAGEEALIDRLDGSMHVIQIVWMRFVAHFATVSALLAWRRLPRPWHAARPALQVLRALALAAMPAFWLLGLRSGAGGVPMLTVFWLSPLLLLLVGPRCFGTAARWPVIVATAIGAVGAWWLLGRTFPRTDDIVAPVGMGVAFAAYVLLTVTLRGTSPLTNLWWVGAGVSVLLTPALPAVWVAPGWHDTLLIVAMALSGLIGLWALEQAVAEGPLWPALPMVFLQLPFAALLAPAHTLLHSADVALGTAVIASAGVVAWRLEARRRKRFVVRPVPQGANR